MKLKAASTSINKVDKTLVRLAKKKKKEQREEVYYQNPYQYRC